MTKNKQMKIVSIAFVFILLVSLLSFSLYTNTDFLLSAKKTTTKTLIVDDEGDGDFTSIQAAINAAESGDTIKIYSGIYFETVHIDTDNLILTGIDFELGLGSDNGKPIIDAQYSGSCIQLNAIQTSLSCCIIQHSGNDTTDAGIKIQAPDQFISGITVKENRNGFFIGSLSNNNNIIENNVSSNKNGFYIFHSNDNSIVGNDVNNNQIGMILDLIAYNTIEANTIQYNTIAGITMNNSWYNTISNNIVSYNPIGFNFSISKINYIFNNDISFNSRGVYLHLASNRNNFSYNYISNNTIQGVYAIGCSTNEFYDNVITDNHDGLVFESTTLNKIYVNTIEDNDENGIVFLNTEKSNIINNSIHSDRYNEGILLTNSNDNYMYLNEIFDAGITCYGSNDNQIIQNTIRNPLNGIYLNSSDLNIISDNTITLSNFDGIYFIASNNNIVYHNYLIDNHRNAYDVKGINSWDNGYPDGGNFWSDYDEASEGANDLYSGENQDEPFGDGIADDPYVIPGIGAQDRYPLIEPIGVPEVPMQPQGSAINIRGKNYRYTTSSTDPNGDLIQYGWDWDGDRSVDEWSMKYESGQTASATHAWTTDGEYMIHVKAMDENGRESDWSEPLAITIPKIKTPFSFLLNFFNHHDLVHFIIETLLYHF